MRLGYGWLRLACSLVDLLLDFVYTLLGKIYTIIEETQQTGRISNGITEWEDGGKSYRVMSNGYANRLSERTLHNSRTGETLTRLLLQPTK